MARFTHATQIDLGFCDAARECIDFGVRSRPGNFARELFHLVGPGWIGTNRQAQPVTQRIFG